MQHQFARIAGVWNRVLVLSFANLYRES